MTRRERRTNIGQRDQQKSFVCYDCSAPAGKPCTRIDPATGDTKRLKVPHPGRGRDRLRGRRG